MPLHESLWEMLIRFNNNNNHHYLQVWAHWPVPSSLDFSLVSPSHSRSSYSFLPLGKYWSVFYGMRSSSVLSKLPANYLHIFLYFFINTLYLIFVSNLLIYFPFSDVSATDRKKIIPIRIFFCILLCTFLWSVC